MNGVISAADAVRMYQDPMNKAVPLSNLKMFKIDNTLQSQPLKVADLLKYLADNLAAGLVQLEDKVMIGSSDDRTPALCISRKGREVILEG